MAYASSTEGSSANVPVLVSYSLSSTGIGSTAPSTGAKGARTDVWRYQSTHTQAEAAATGFITDARTLGMKLGDSVFVIGSTTIVISHHVVNALSSTGATLSAGLCVSSAS